MNRPASISVTDPRFWLTDGRPLNSGAPFGSRRPVVIFDSGVGGLTVAKHIREIMPSLDLLYVADNEWFPYGVKPSAAIAARVANLYHLLRRLLNPLAMVVACNTASVAIHESPVDAEAGDWIRISPPVAEATKISLSRKIVVLATAGTLASATIREAIAAEGHHASVWPVPSQMMVDLAEKKIAGEQVDVGSICRLISTHLSEEERVAVDTIVLGCTHFPHLVDELRQVFPAARNWIDPAYLAALQLHSRLRDREHRVGEAIRLTALTSVHGMAKYDRVFSSHGFGKARSMKELLGVSELS